MYILGYNICVDGREKIIAIFSLIKTAIQIIRIIVPIGLVLMTGIDIFKKVIKPDEKDGQRKILIRILASILVFFVPIMVNFIIKLVNVGQGNDEKGTPCYNAWVEANAK